MVASRLLEIPVSVQPVDAIRAMRLIAESRGWQTKLIEESRMVHRWAIVMPITRQARVIGFHVTSGEATGFSIRTWSQTPGSAGSLVFVSFEIPRQLEGDRWDSIIKEWVKGLPRCPWKWTFGERSRLGYMLPEFKRSRVQFTKQGIDTKSWIGSDLDLIKRFEEEDN